MLRGSERFVGNISVMPEIVTRKRSQKMISNWR